MIDFKMQEDYPKTEIEFDQRFSNPDTCYEYLAKTRWPNGFICEKCGHNAFWVSAKHIYICTRCEHQYSLTAGTIMHRTRKPITYWFKAMWWFTTRKSGVNAVNLKELLGLGSYQTAWTWLQKLRRCTNRKDREKLSGRVEVDEFFVGGQKTGKRGRGADGKTIVYIAVERDMKQDPSTLEEYWQIGRARMQVALDCSSYSLETFINHNIEAGSIVATDKWSSYQPIVNIRYHHEVIDAPDQKGSESRLYGAHLVVSLVKRLIRSTFQGRFEPKYLQNYLDEYVFRFNRRKSISIGKKFMRIVQQVMRSRNISNKDIQLDLDPISEYFSLGLSG
jgi:transposase-like protein